jgi:hypothetical protein
MPGFTATLLGVLSMVWYTFTRSSLFALLSSFFSLLSVPTATFSGEKRKESVALLRKALTLTGSTAITGAVCDRRFFCAAKFNAPSPRFCKNSALRPGKEDSYYAGFERIGMDV